MALTPEGKVKKLVKDWLKLHNIWNVSIIPSSFGSSTGLPDIFCLHKGLMLGLEIKAEGKSKNVTVKQQQAIDAINDNGGLAMVISGEFELYKLEAELLSRGLL